MIKVLILEDEITLGRVYKKRLEGAGFSVEWTKTVAETEERVGVFRPDVILLDHGIPGYEKRGVDLIVELRAFSPASKIIMLSNYSDSPLQKKALQDGADAYLVKINTPPQVLISFLQNLISSRK